MISSDDGLEHVKTELGKLKVRCPAQRGHGEISSHEGRLDIFEGTPEGHPLRELLLDYVKRYGDELYAALIDSTDEQYIHVDFLKAISVHFLEKRREKNAEILTLKEEQRYMNLETGRLNQREFDRQQVHTRLNREVAHSARQIEELGNTIANYVRNIASRDTTIKNLKKTSDLGSKAAVEKIQKKVDQQTRRGDKVQGHRGATAPAQEPSGEGPQGRQETDQRQGPYNCRSAASAG